MKFALKVWLTSLITAPLIIIFLFTAEYRDAIWLLSSWAFCTVAVAILSSPFAIIFYLVMKVVRKQNWPILYKKGLLILTGIVLSAVTFHFLLLNPDMKGLIALKVVVTYSLTTTLGIIIYKLSV
jgi:hypothetical protein